MAGRYGRTAILGEGVQSEGYSAERGINTLLTDRDEYSLVGYLVPVPVGARAMPTLVHQEGAIHNREGPL